MFVIVTGDNDCFGPFGTEEAATIWATARFGAEEDTGIDSSNPDWEVVPLRPTD
jgi:hypothetical protein